MSDGECSGPGIISFCSHDPGAILVPDLEFVWNRGYGDCRLHARANLTAWRARSDLIVWRGSTTGQGTVAKESLAADDASLLPRVRLCLRLREIPGTDAKISNVAQSDDRARYQQLLTRAGIMGEFISHMAWHSLKFAIDIDGNSNAWSNLFMRLLMGCCVLKVASPQGYRQWYYDDLKPWTHYVPVKADLSDLTAQIAWCRANMQACERIAAAGQAFAMAHSYETEVAAAAERVFAAFKQGTLRTTLP